MASQASQGSPWPHSFCPTSNWVGHTVPSSITVYQPSELQSHPRHSHTPGTASLASLPTVNVAASVSITEVLFPDKGCPAGTLDFI